MITIEIGNKKYKVQEARTEEEKEKGLQGVTELPEDEGMLFYFDPPEDIGNMKIDITFKYDHPIATYNLEGLRQFRFHTLFKEMSGIYIIKNIINNKMYIGSTKNFMKRISEHLHLLEIGSHHSIKLQNSINKYHFSNFEIRIYPINTSREYLYDIEEKLIKEFNSFSNGYNMSENSRTMTGWTEQQREQMKERMRNRTLGKKCSEEHKRKVGIAKSIQNSGEGNPKSKLTKDDVLFIRNNVSQYTCNEFCSMFKVKKTAIRNIVHLRSWNYEDCIPDNYIPPKRMKV